MAQSYVLEGTNIVCTEMRSSAPAKLGRAQREAFVIHGGENKPLLNISDKKLSIELKCKIGGKFWGGLMVLTAVLAVAAFAVAVVATGGLALVAAGLALVAVSAVGCNSHLYLSPQL